MDIEEVAKTDPSAIKKYTVDIVKGFHKEDAAKVADQLQLTGKLRDQAIDQL